MATGYRTTIMATVLAVGFAFATATHSQTPPASTQNPSQKPAEMNMSMGDMMKQCREHCSLAGKQMDELMKKMSEARTSNDPAKMRSALEDAQKPMTDMKTHMDQCTHMMDMMQNMGGMMKKK